MLRDVGDAGDGDDLLLLVLGERLFAFEALGHELAGTAAQLGLALELAAVLPPGPTDDEHAEDAHVAQDGVDPADELREADEGQDEADEDDGDVDLVEVLTVVAGEAFGQGVEHADGRVVDHAVDGKRHERTERRVNLGDHSEGGHVRLQDGLDGDVHGADEHGEEEEEDEAADDAAEADLARVEEVAADDDGHGHYDDDLEANRVDGRDPPVGQRRGNLLCLLVEVREVGLRGKDGVHRADGDEHNDERSDGADDLGDLVHIEEAGEQDEGQHDARADPDVPTELLLHIRSGAREHGEADAEETRHRRDVEDAGGHGAGDDREHRVVVLRAVVAAQLQHGDAGNHDADGRHDGANNAPVAERNEVLEGLAAGGEARADEDANEGHGDA